MSARHAVVIADYHIFWVGVEDWTRFDYDYVEGSSPLLMEPVPRLGGAFVHTKVHTGAVATELVYHAARPELDLDGWEDADLLVVDCPLGDLGVGPVGGGGEAIDEIVPGPGTYTVCCSSRGRDAANELEWLDVPIEHYRFDVWPTEPGDASRTLKQTSEYGHGTPYWDEVARTPQPPPPTPEEQAAEAAREAERQAQEEAACWQQMEIDDWGGSLPSEALRSGGEAAQRLAHTHRRLADEIACLDTATLKRVALWAASTACARAGDAGLDWQPALDALDRGSALPPPFDDPIRAMERLYGPLGTMTVENHRAADPPVRIDPPAAALATVLAAADTSPTAAAFNAIEQAASAVDQEVLLSALRHQFGLG